jgi:hypothetical protein
MDMGCNSFVCVWEEHEWQPNFVACRGAWWLFLG